MFSYKGYTVYQAGSVWMIKEKNMAAMSDREAMEIIDGE